MFDVLHNSQIRKYRKIISKINSISVESLNEDEMADKLHKELSIYTKNADLVYVYAIIKETFRRTLNINLYDEQLMGAIAMNDGYFTEVKTGEGKTYIAVIHAIIKSYKNQILVVTLNDFIANRDYIETKSIFKYLNISSNINTTNITFFEKEEIYKSQVIYTTSAELVFDYLKNKEYDNNLNIKFDYAIIDEVDFILIDNACSKFSVSYGERCTIDSNLNYYLIANEIFKGFIGGEMNYFTLKNINEESLNIDYIYCVSERKCYITKQGMNKAELIFNKKNLIDFKIMYKALVDTIVTNCIYKKDVDYIVQEDSICLINRSDGRLMKNSHKEKGEQLALEIKEKVRISLNNNCQNSISYQVFFNKFKDIVGMSGTLNGAEEEFYSIFNHNCFAIPTHLESKRIDFGTKYFKTKRDKYKYFIKYLISHIVSNNKGCLVICDNEYETKYISKLLAISKIKFEILNSYNVLNEQAIIDNAGKNNTITITTNMLGRGTDIKITDEIYDNGGLQIIALNKYSNVRIENQIRGRVSRQGQPGSCLFLSSLEDQLFLKHDLVEINKYLRLDLDLFSAKKTQKKINKIALNLQSKTTGNEYLIRNFNYKVSHILELQKEYLENQIINFSLDDNFWLFLDKFVENELSTLLNKNNKRVIIFFGSSVNLMQNNETELYIDDIKKEIKSNIEIKINELNKEMSELALKQIYKDLFVTFWHGFSIDMEELGTMYNIKTDYQGVAFPKYILEADKKVEIFQRFLYIKTIEKFLTIKIKNRGLL